MPSAVGVLLEVLLATGGHREASKEARSSRKQLPFCF